MNEVVPLLAVGMAAGLYWLLAKPPAVFVVRFHDSVPFTAHGKVTPGFLAAVNDVFREFAVSSGEVRGLRRGSRIVLWFSSHIPAAARQRLRNWWVISGWPAPRGR